MTSPFERRAFLLLHKGQKVTYHILIKDKKSIFPIRNFI